MRISQWMITISIISAQRQLEQQRLYNQEPHTTSRQVRTHSNNARSSLKTYDNTGLAYNKHQLNEDLGFDQPKKKKQDFRLLHSYNLHEKKELPRKQEDSEKSRLSHPPSRAVKASPAQTFEMNPHSQIEIASDLLRSFENDHRQKHGHDSKALQYKVPISSVPQKAPAGWKEHSERQSKHNQYPVFTLDKHANKPEVQIERRRRERTPNARHKVNFETPQADDERPKSKSKKGRSRRRTRSIEKSREHGDAKQKPKHRLKAYKESVSSNHSSKVFHSKKKESRDRSRKNVSIESNDEVEYVSRPKSHKHKKASRRYSSSTSDEPQPQK